MKEKKFSEKTILFGLIRSLGSHLDFKDQEAILQVMEGTQPPYHLPSLEEREILASFFALLKEAGVMESLKRAQVLNYKRVMVPIDLLLLTYITKILIGIPSMNALPQLLFSHTDLMRTIGFQDSLLKTSICRRGEHGRSLEKEPPVPFSPQMLSNFMERFSQEEVELLFNTVIKRLTEFGIFPPKIRAFFDYANLKTTEKYRGCGRKVSTRKEIRESALVEVKEEEYGFKLVALLDLQTKIPLAVKLLEIQEEESAHFLDLLKTAEENTGRRPRIMQLTSNRSLLSMEDLTHLDHLGILFHTKVKKDGEIYRRVQELAKEGHGREKNTTLSQRIITLKSVEGLLLPHTPIHNLNAVVITEDPHRPQSAHKRDIFLTNDEVNEPLYPFQKYNQTSIIESLLHEQGQQGWHLQKPPKKNKETMNTHAFLTMLTFGLTRAYRKYSKSYRQMERA